jgi:hypothetical protein
MHIHPAAMGLHSISTYAAAENERAAAAKRAAEVRKRLLKAAQTANTNASPEETLLLGRWLNAPLGEALPAGPNFNAGDEDSDLA